MAQYNLAGNIDSNKVFLINRSELEGRFEVQYYLPEINQLEKTIRKKSTKKLRDFIVKISSGATPSVQEEEKFYSDELNGIPFLRVQNLNPNGRIDLSNLRYINKETHENYLRRSQVSEGDLLVKITGVGRMAIASVAPLGFIGNTNQHMAVVKTSDVEVSKYLANYLNLDLVEKLASRRATGATRPALDYSALKSIPIIENIDFSIINDAEELSRKKEAEAKALLESIDSYLLEELGITLPEKTEVKTEDIPAWMNPENLLVKNGRLFVTSSREVIGQRLDTDYTLKIGFLNALQSKYPFVQMKDIIDRPPQYGANEESIEGNPDTDIRYIRITDIDEFGNLRQDTFRTATTIESQYLLSVNDLLFARSGATAGKCYIHKSTDKDSIFAGYLIRFSLKSDIALPDYVFHFCNSKLYAYWVSMIQRPSAQPNINSEEFKSLQIPLPPMEKQLEIASYITSTRQRAFELRENALNLLELTKRQVEIMILGE